MGAGALFLGIKRQKRKADHSPPFSVEVKNGGALHPLPYTSSWSGGKLITHRKNFTLTLYSRVCQAVAASPS
jgi:hypothetical protein